MFYISGTISEGPMRFDTQKSEVIDLKRRQRIINYPKQENTLLFFKRLKSVSFFNSGATEAAFKGKAAAINPKIKSDGQLVSRQREHFTTSILRVIHRG